MKPRPFLLIAGLWSLGACASLTSHVLVGGVRPPVSADQVRVYLEPPAGDYERIAVIDSSSKYSFFESGPEKTETIIRRMQQDAARLGANGLLLQQITDEPHASIGAGVGTQSESARGTMTLGISTSGVWSSRYGRALAIYLYSTSAPRSSSSCRNTPR
jgi:hypothetical protein